VGFFAIERTLADRLIFGCLEVGAKSLTVTVPPQIAGIVRCVGPPQISLNSKALS
jgi:hypothetical protein